MTIHILLDFDGVAARSARARHYQFARSVKFMHRVLEPRVSFAECARINARLYPVHGHTVNVLNNEFGAGVTLRDYNDFVFDPHVLRTAPSLKNSSMEAHEEAECDELARCCKELDAKLSIFTNANPAWVAYMVRGNLRHCPIIHPDNDISLLKPQPAAYQRVNKAFPHDNFVFIDDSRGNCDAAETYGGPRWIAAHFKSDLKDTLLGMMQRLRE